MKMENFIKIKLIIMKSFRSMSFGFVVETFTTETHHEIQNVLNCSFPNVTKVMFTQVEVINLIKSQIIHTFKH